MIRLSSSGRLPTLRHRFAKLSSRRSARRSQNAAVFLIVIMARCVETASLPSSTQALFLVLALIGEVAIIGQRLGESDDQSIVQLASRSQSRLRGSIVKLLEPAIKGRLERWFYIIRVSQDLGCPTALVGATVVRK